MLCSLEWFPWDYIYILFIYLFIFLTCYFRWLQAIHQLQDHLCESTMNINVDFTKSFVYCRYEHIWVQHEGALRINVGLHVPNSHFLKHWEKWVRMLWTIHWEGKKTSFHVPKSVYIYRYMYCYATCFVRHVTYIITSVTWKALGGLVTNIVCKISLLIWKRAQAIKGW